MKKAAVAFAACLIACGINSGSVFAQKADNTKQNESAMHGALTPDKTNNDKASVETMAKLRRAIMAQKGLSMNAQNVKIIAKSGSLILRGVVDSVHEKNTLDTLAGQICPNFKDDLTVKSRK